MISEMISQWLSHVPWSLLVWIVALYVIWQLGKRLVWIGSVIMVLYYASALLK